MARGGLCLCWGIRVAFGFWGRVLDSLDLEPRQELVML